MFCEFYKILIIKPPGFLLSFKIALFISKWGECAFLVCHKMNYFYKVKNNKKEKSCSMHRL